MFKRGAFEVDAVVHPVAIKYNKIFVDAFWNSRWGRGGGGVLFGSGREDEALYRVSCGAPRAPTAFF